jgi:hypothetical protein
MASPAQDKQNASFDFYIIKFGITRHGARLLRSARYFNKAVLNRSGMWFIVY